VLDDRNAAAQQKRVCGPARVGHVVDVDRVDADQRHARFGQVLRRRAGDVRMVRLRIGLAPPVARPVGMNEERGAAKIERRHVVDLERAFARRQVHEHTAQVRDAGQRQLADVRSILEAVERRVDVGAGVRDHLDPSDVKLGLAAVTLARRRTGEMVRDYGAGQAGVREHAVLDRMAEVHQLRRHASIVSQPRIAASPPVETLKIQESPLKNLRFTPARSESTLTT
jgi:hypothetical protein